MVEPTGFEVVGGTAGVADLVAAGTNVVVVMAEGVVPGPFPDGPGRVAVLVGDWDDDDVRSAAASMGAEVFGT